MPFTLAHPAIILPLAKSKNISMTALVVGCMVPDFEFFLQMREVRNIGHHWYGILLFDLPVAIIFCYLFHNLLKKMLVTNLPAQYRNKFLPVLEFNWNAYANANKTKVLLCLLAGIVSHIAWDAFTHHNGVMVLLIPGLAAKFNVLGTQLPVYFMLQIFSSIVGMCLVYFFIQQMQSNKYENILFKQNKYYWPLLILVFAIVVLGRIFIWPQFNSFWGVVMACMGGFIYAWVFTSFILKNSNTKTLLL